MRKLLAATALALVSAAPASAAVFTVTFSIGNVATIVPSGDFPNEFHPYLTSAPFNLFSSVNKISSITLDEASLVNVDFMGSESGYENRFTLGSLSFVETDGDNFGIGGVDKGTAYVSAAELNLNPIMYFTGPAGAEDGHIGASPLTEGFGVFIPFLDVANPSAAFQSLGGGVWTFTTNTLMIGYDDQMGLTQPLGGDDDNHDDMVIRLVAAPVPEASTWAMLIAGFMTVGAALRRRNGGRKLIQAV